MFKFWSFRRNNVCTHSTNEASAMWFPKNSRTAVLFHTRLASPMAECLHAHTKHACIARTLEQSTLCGNRSSANEPPDILAPIARTPAPKNNQIVPNAPRYGVLPRSMPKQSPATMASKRNPCIWLMVLYILYVRACMHALFTDTHTHAYTH